VRTRFGAVHALVNNAGRAPRVRPDLLEASEDSFEEIVRTNLQGPYFLTQAIARDQIARRAADPAFEAAIVFITSVSAELASINRGEYCVSKAARRWRPGSSRCGWPSTRFPVYEVRPGIIATDMTAPNKEAYDKRLADGLAPERRWGQPEDVGRSSPPWCAATCRMPRAA
jgi:NAD(P)-dependent dehydrogenase (short-subunit alcohol dehydrogenase family)